MSNIDQTTLDFFRQVKSKFPQKDDGSLDISRLNCKFLSTLDDSQASKFIREGLSDAARGRLTFKPLLDFYYQKQVKEGESSDKIFMSKLVKGDTSDLEALGTLMDDFSLFTAAVHEVMYETYYPSRLSTTLLWKEGKLLPERLQDKHEKYVNDYDLVVANNGDYCEMEDGRLVLEGHEAINLSLRDGHYPEDKVDKMKFVSKICKLYDESMHGHDHLISDSWSKEDGEKEGQYFKDEMEKSEKAKAGISEIDTYLSQYGSSLWGNLKGLFNKKQIQEKEQARKKLSTSVIDDKRAENWQDNLNEKNDNREVAEKMEAGYAEILRERVVPALREKFKGHQHEDTFNELINYFFSEQMIEFYKGDSITKIYNFIASIAGKAKVDLDDLFRDACININGLANVVIQAGSAEDLEFEDLLKMVMTELKSAPVREGEKPLSTEYRTEQFRDRRAIAYPALIREKLNKCTSIYETISETDELDAYVSGVGKIGALLLDALPYEDGNSRAVRYLSNVLLAKEGIVVPSFCDSLVERADLNNTIYTTLYHSTNRVHGVLNSWFSDTVKNKGIDLSNQNRLRPDSGERIIEEGHSLDEEQKRREEEESSLISADERHTL